MLPGRQQSSNPSDLQEELLQHLLTPNLQEFERLLNHPAVTADHKYGEPHFSSCLEIACRHLGTKDFIKLLLKKVKPSINQIRPEPIHYAAKKGNWEALEVLLKDKRIYVNAEDSSGRTALHHAASNFINEEADNYEDCIKLLMCHPQMDINRPSKKGFTALHEAAATGCERAVKAILKYSQGNIDVDRFRGHGMTARDLLLKKYPEIEKDLPLPIVKHTEPHLELLAALKKGNVDIFRVLLKRQDSDGKSVLNPNYWFSKPYNTTILEAACRKDVPICEQFVRIALQAGSDPNMVNKLTKKSPIHVVTEEGNFKALHVLSSYQLTDINAIDNNGQSALHYSVKRENSEEEEEEETYERRLKCLKMLLMNDDLDINLKDKNGHSALFLAVSCKNKESIIILLKQQKHPLDLDYNVGSSELTIRDIIIETYSDLKDILPSHSTTLDKPKDMRKELFQYLYKNEEDNFISSLLRTNCCENLRINFLQYCCKNGLQDCVRVLLDMAKNPNAITGDNKSPPLVLACEYKHFDIVTLFLNVHQEKYFNINATDMRGNSALHYAVWNEDLETIIALINTGADTKLKNILGKSPFGRKHLDKLLNKCIKTNKMFPSEQDYEIMLDYRLLTAHTTNTSPSKYNICRVPIDRRAYNVVGDRNAIFTDGSLTFEMKFLYFVSKCEEIGDLLNHPVSLTFLELKTRKLKVFSKLNLILYALFLICLNMHVFFVPQMSRNLSKRNESLNTNSSNTGSGYDNPVLTTVISSLCAILVILLFIRELFQFTMSYKNYIRNFENIIDIVIIVFTVVILLLPDLVNSHNGKFIIVLDILFSAFELLLLLGRLPKFATYFEILEVVLKNYFWSAVFYSVLIIAYALSFHVLFHEMKDDNGDNWFDTILPSILKTLVMVTGEFDVEEKALRADPQGYSILLIIFLIVFVILMSIVLLNLLIGLAVNDTQTIQKDASLLSLKSRVKVAKEAESVLIHFHNFLIRIGCCGRFPCVYLHKVCLFPTYAERKEGYIKPNSSPDIKLSSQDDPLTLDRTLLEKSVRIINNEINICRPSTEESRLQKLEESMEKILNILSREHN